MSKIGIIVGMLVFLMILGTSMAAGAEGDDAPLASQDYNDANIVLSGPVGNDNDDDDRTTGSDIDTNPGHSEVFVW